MSDVKRGPEVREETPQNDAINLTPDSEAREPPDGETVNLIGKSGTAPE